MIKETISRLVNFGDLSYKDAEQIFEAIFDGQVSPAQIAAFLVALRMKAETENEIWAAAKVARSKAKKLKLAGLSKKSSKKFILDTCGTGGSGINKFNISTAVSFVMSSYGIKVAKHGNRAMSSSCGSADVLEEMGININVNPQIMEEAIEKIGIGFLFAPLYHPALGQVAGIRRQLGVRTIFNILGPLCSPAFASHQLLGVYTKELIFTMARVLNKLGTKKAFVVHSKDLKDEVSLGSQTQVVFLNNKKLESFKLKPSDFGLKKVDVNKLRVKDKKESAEVIGAVFNGKKGAARDTILASVSCCLYILGEVKSLKEGVAVGAELIDSGRPKDKVSKFKDFLDSRANKRYRDA